MGCNITVVLSNGDLQKDEWTFWVTDDLERMILNRYYRFQKTTKRHGWRVFDHYNRLNTRDSSIKVDQVPFENWLVESARQKLAQKVFGIAIVK